MGTVCDFGDVDFDYFVTAHYPQSVARVRHDPPPPAVNRLEAAKQQWQAGFRSRVGMVQAMLSPRLVADRPTPLADGDD
jgi:hypothetical protein